MLPEQTIDQLKSLKLPGMLETYDRQLADPGSQKLSFDERFAGIVEAEGCYRAQRLQDRLFRAAKLKNLSACLEAVDYRARRGLDKSAMSNLASGAWVERHQHVLITGPTGAGKTWLACALAQQMIRQARSVWYRRLPRLLEEIEIARGDGSLPKLRAKLDKVKLLILDDWAVAPITVRGRQDLLELVEDRTGSGSLLITSQLPVTKWHEYLGEPTLADAILDRIVHRAHHIKLKGESMRKLMAKKRGAL